MVVQDLGDFIPRSPSNLSNSVNLLSRYKDVPRKKRSSS